MQFKSSIDLIEKPLVKGALLIVLLGLLLELLVLLTLLLELVVLAVLIGLLAAELPTAALAVGLLAELTELLTTPVVCAG